MLGVRAFCACLVAITLLLPSTSMAQGVVRGLVVDRNTKNLWLGFPVPVTQGSTFDITLVPGGKAIARALVVDATTDAPYVAKADFVLLDKSAFIPVGAYAEQSAVGISDLDELPGYRSPNVSPEKTNPLSLQAGALFITNDDMRDETDSVWPSVELDYRCSRTPGSEIYIGLGYTGATGNSVETIDSVPVPVTRQLNVYPLTINGKFRSGGNRGAGWFGRVGAGAYYVRDRRSVNNVSNVSDKTRFGWQAGFGYESKSGRSAQLSYVDVSGTDINGVMLSLGARF